MLISDSEGNRKVSDSIRLVFWPCSHGRRCASSQTDEMEIWREPTSDARRENKGLLPKRWRRCLRVVGSLQYMVLRKYEKPFNLPFDGPDSTGIPKGIRQALWEGGVLTSEMGLKEKIDCDGRLRVETSSWRFLNSQSDFQWEPCALSQHIERQKALGVFTSNFQPELNCMERARGRAKLFLRLLCNYTFPRLKSRLRVALGIVPMTERQKNCHSRLREVEYALSKALIWKQGRMLREFVRAYGDCDGTSVSREAIKKLRGRRETSTKEFH